MVNVRLGAQIELAKRDFFEYCHLKAPDFYKYDRPFLIDLADTLQSFAESDDDVLIVNEPPRHGKSRTAGNFVEWLLGCLLYTSPSPRDRQKSRMPSSA